MVVVAGCVEAVARDYTSDNTLMGTVGSKVKILCNTCTIEYNTQGGHWIETNYITRVIIYVIQHYYLLFSRNQMLFKKFYA